MPRKPSKVGFRDSGWHRTVFGQVQGTFLPQMHVACGWDKLLNELHLTDEAALSAVATNDKAGMKLRRFARRVHRARYVPEDVLLLLDLNRKSGDGSLSLQNLRSGGDEAE
jgi:hypothetical protein